MDTLDNNQPQIVVTNEAEQLQEISTTVEAENTEKSEEREDFNSYDRETLLTKFKELIEGDELSRHRGIASAIIRAFRAKEAQPTTEDAPTTENVEIENTTEETEKTTVVDVVSAKFNELMKMFNEKISELDAVREKNYTAKKDILDKFQILSQEGDLSKSIPQFFTLQKEWKAIGPVPADKKDEIQKEYSHYIDVFHPMIKMYNEARLEELNRNYKFKLELCEKLEALKDSEDRVEAFGMLKQYRAQWNETGSIPSEKREEINKRFSEAAEIVYNRYREFVSQQKENDNVINDTRSAICDELESIDIENANTNKQWEEIIAKVSELQAKWKETGEPQFRNSKLGRRYKSICEKIYQTRIQFYKRIKSNLAENLKKKRELLAEVEAIKESTNWQDTANKITEIQKRWKEIGAVSHKNSEALWNQFQASCNYFFNRRAEARKGKPEEIENMNKKMEVIERINAFVPSGNNDEDRKSLRALVDEFAAIGHVPYREKEKVQKAYREACDKQFGLLRGAVGESYTLSAIAQGKGGSEKSRLMKQYEALKAEIVQYENNLGFLNAASKNGNTLVEQVSKKIADLKQQLNDISARINLIDEADKKEEEPKATEE